MKTQALSKERLEEVAELARKATYKPCALHMSNLIASCDSEIVEAMARALLAAHEQEPYGYVHKAIYETVGSCGLSSDHEAYRDTNGDHIPLYRHPAPVMECEQEPVAWMWDIYGGHMYAKNKPLHMPAQPLYTHPAPSIPAAVPELPEEALSRLEQEANHVTAWHHMDEHSCKVNRRDLLTIVNACRGAMLQSEPDGWIPVSERLPEESTDADGGATGYLVRYADGKEPNGGFNVGVWNVTYLRKHYHGLITHWQPLPAAPKV